MSKVTTDSHGFPKDWRRDRVPEAENPHLQDWAKSNLRASGPKNVDEYRAELTGKRWLAYCLLASAFAAYAIWWLTA